MCYDLFRMYDCGHFSSTIGVQYLCERFVRKDEICKIDGHIPKHWEPISHPSYSRRAKWNCPPCRDGKRAPATPDQITGIVDEDQYGEWLALMEERADERKLRRRLLREESEELAREAYEIERRHALEEERAKARQQRDVVIKSVEFQVDNFDGAQETMQETMQDAKRSKSDETVDADESFDDTSDDASLAAISKQLSQLPRTSPRSAGKKAGESAHDGPLAKVQRRWFLRPRPNRIEASSDIPVKSIETDESVVAIRSLDTIEGDKEGKEVDEALMDTADWWTQGK